jgi:hypothetical protein
MKHLVFALALVALTVPSAAFGKGATGATIDGPGSGGGITFKSGDQRNGPTELSQLVEYSGLYPALFGQEPNPMLASRPKGDLGPKYIVTYTIPTSASDEAKIRQEVYPYAKPAPVTYMQPGQKIFDGQTRGGWFQADQRLKQTLVAAGLPAQAPATTSGDSSFPIDLVGLMAGALLLAAATTFAVRRRMRPAQAT